MHRSALQDMLELTARPDLTSFALGLPASELFPKGAIAAALAELLAANAGALQYGPPEAELRGFVARLMRRRGVHCAPEQIFLTAGAQQGMALLCRLLLDPGAAVVLEAHSYTGFHQAIAPHRPRLLTVPSDPEHGMDVDAVERALRADRHPALIYAMSDGHNPLGVSMPLDRRRRLVELAAAYGVPVIEDDAYGLLAYDGGDGLPALRSLDAQWVLYIGSFSKTLAPALRTGWLVVPERLVGPLASLKESSDINTAPLGQRAVAAFVASGAFDAHLELLRAAYAKRRDAMLQAVAQEFPSGTRWSRPAAGFFTWVELPEPFDALALLRVALERERVAFLPGAAFAVGGAAPARHALRLNFSFSSLDVIRDGMARLGRAIREGERG